MATFDWHNCVPIDFSILALCAQSPVWPLKRRLLKQTSFMYRSNVREPVLKPVPPSYTIYSNSLPPSIPDIPPPELREVVRYTYL